MGNIGAPGNACASGTSRFVFVRYLRCGYVSGVYPRGIDAAIFSRARWSRSR
jgi:hypothetical protein